VHTDLDSLAITVVFAMDGRTLATAESITGGEIGATITSVPGSSKIYRGGITSYATDLKESLLGVDHEVLKAGAVQAEVALQMAKGVATKLNADFGLAVTGVAGPDPQDGVAAGTVYIACAERNAQGDFVEVVVEDLHFQSELTDPVLIRAEIRDETVGAALELLMSFL